jgi:hypothetical protein
MGIVRFVTYDEVSETERELGKYRTGERFVNGMEFEYLGVIQKVWDTRTILHIVDDGTGTDTLETEQVVTIRPLYDMQP